MKNKPTNAKLPVLTQLCKLISPYLVSKLVREYGIDKQARTSTAWSHVVSLLFAQLTHSIGLTMSVTHCVFTLVGWRVFVAQSPARAIRSRMLTKPATVI